MEDGSPRRPDAEIGDARAGAVKDHECPFCHTPFTASSLGRHLDQLIKEKNPKSTDGVHDVNRIRELRGGITRRNKKGLGRRRPYQQSIGFATSSTGRIHDLDPIATTVSTNPLGPPSLTAQDAPGQLSRRPGWQATGVINGLPPRVPTESPVAGPQHSTPGRQIEDNASISMAASIRQSAAEAALKDILDNIEQASARLRKPEPFQFDVFELTFPSLCLKILDAPGTIFSAMPFDSQGPSWPIDPPTFEHRKKVKQAILRNLEAHLKIHPSAKMRRCTNLQDFEKELARELEQKLKPYLKHVDYAVQQWQPLPAAEKQRIWITEILRAYATAVKDEKNLNARLAEANSINDDLRAELQRLKAKHELGGSRDSSMPRNRAPHLTDALVNELSETSPDLQIWDFRSIMQRYNSVMAHVNSEGFSLPSASDLSAQAYRSLTSPQNGVPATSGSNGDPLVERLPASQESRMNAAVSEDVEMSDEEDQREQSDTG